MMYTDGSSFIEGPDPLPGCSEGCAFPLSGEHEPTCLPVPGEAVTIVNPESCFRGATGTVISVYLPSRTVYVQGSAGWTLPFGASEVER